MHIHTPPPQKKKQERRGKECLSCFVFQETCYHFLFIRRCYRQEDLEKARVVLLPMFFFGGFSQLSIIAVMAGGGYIIRQESDGYTEKEVQSGIWKGGGRKEGVGGAS